MRTAGVTLMAMVATMLLWSVVLFAQDAVDEGTVPAENVTDEGVVAEQEMGDEQTRDEEAEDVDAGVQVAEGQDEDGDSDFATEEDDEYLGVRRMSLQECIETALANNHQRPASQFAIRIAEAQNRQALSAYWPTVLLQSSFMRLDSDPTFTFPATRFEVPGSTMTPGATTVSIPANAFGPGFPPVGVQMPVQSPPINVPAMQFESPPIAVNIMDRDTWDTSLTLTYPLYTGGLREGLVRQSRAGVQAAQQDATRTDLAVIRDVKRMYFGAVLARQLLSIGREALSRLEVTLELTESLYQSGSGRVKKTDYLRNKMIVETLRSIIASTESQEKSARAALANTMALPWDVKIAPAAMELPDEPLAADLSKLVGSAYRFNPDWGKLAAGLEAAAGKVQEAKSGSRVKVGLTGSLHYAVNSQENGLLGDSTHWAVGIGLNMPIFDGYLAKNQIREAQARLSQLQEQKELLRGGIALQVQHIFLTMSGAQAALKASQSAHEVATENRDLNERAYQDELVETQDVIEAQIMESMAAARHELALHQQAVSQADLDFVVGSEVGAMLAPEE